MEHQELFPAFTLRLLALRDKYDKTQAELGKMLGMSQVQYSRYEQGKIKTKSFSNILSALTSAFPDISKEWIRTGSGGMLDKNFPVEKLQTIQLPYAGSLASASFNNNADSKNFIESYLEISKIPGVDYTDRIAVKVSGRSMEPTIMDGAIVLVKSIEKEDVKSGVFLFDYQDEIVCKRILDNDMSDGYLSIHSDNPKSGTQRVYAADIRKIYKVEHIIHSTIE